MRCLSFEPEERPDNPLSWIGTQLAESKQDPAGSDPVVIPGDENEAAAKAAVEAAANAKAAHRAKSKSSKGKK